MGKSDEITVVIKETKAELKRISDEMMVTNPITTAYSSYQVSVQKFNELVDEALSIVPHVRINKFSTSSIPKYGDTLPSQRKSILTQVQQELARLEILLEAELKNTPEKSKSAEAVMDNAFRRKLEQLIEEAKRISTDELNTPDKGCLMPDFISGPRESKWRNDLEIMFRRDLEDYPLQYKVLALLDGTLYQSTMREIVGVLESVVGDDAYWLNKENDMKRTEKDSFKGKKEVFVVHGHDNEAKQTVARVLEKLGMKPIILHEQPSGGDTIIEKIDHYSNVDYAVVLYTGCDIGRKVGDSEIENKKRARQNVVFEHGYLIGKLGRDKVIALVKGDIETPGDISGVVYTSMDDKGAWKQELVKEMKNVGLPVDANDLF